MGDGDGDGERDLRPDDSGRLPDVNAFTKTR